MQTYVVIFVTSSKKDALISKIKESSGWANIAPNSYAVVTSKTASQLRDELLQLKAPNDQIFVIRSGTVAAWSNYGLKTSEWFKKHL